MVAGAGANTMGYTDPAGDVRGGGGADYDIVRTTHGHRGGFLVHTTKTRGPHTDDSPGPELYIRVGTGSHPGLPCQRRRRVPHRHRLADPQGRQRPAGAVTARTFELLFRPRAINNPRRYQWRIYMGAPGGAIDRAPAGYVTHVLR